MFGWDTWYISSLPFPLMFIFCYYFCLMFWFI